LGIKFPLWLGFWIKEDFKNPFNLNFWTIKKNVISFIKVDLRELDFGQIPGFPKFNFLKRDLILLTSKGGYWKLLD